MSYLTSHHLQWDETQPGAPSAAEVVTVLTLSNPVEITATARADGSPKDALSARWGEAISDGPVEWRHRQHDMALVSSLWPQVRFTLTGEGEGMGDLWREYYLGGRVQFVDGWVEYPPFDSRELTEPESWDLVEGVHTGFVHRDRVFLGRNHGYDVLPVQGLLGEVPVRIVAEDREEALRRAYRQGCFGQQ